MGKSEVVMVTKSGHLFRCQHCKYTISSRRGISLHLKYSHNIKDSREGLNEHTCNTCGKTFNNVYLTKKHVMRECKSVK